MTGNNAVVCYCSTGKNQFSSANKSSPGQIEQAQSYLNSIEVSALLGAMQLNMTIPANKPLAHFKQRVEYVSYRGRSNTILRLKSVKK
jgi:chitinase